MRIIDLLESEGQPDLPSLFKTFLPIAMKEIGIDSLPPIRLQLKIDDEEQPTFGKYVNEEGVIYLGIENRHPLDILRTLAHELVHFKQGVDHKLGPTSGETGSPEENQAHEIAGIIMRHFNKKYPKNFDLKPVTLSEDWQKVNKKDKTDGLSQKAVNAYRRENPGSKLKTAVTKDPKKIKKGSSDDKRRKSFCARMSGMKKHNASAKTKRDPDSPINKALRRWNC